MAAQAASTVGVAQMETGGSAVVCTARAVGQVTAVEQGTGVRMGAVRHAVAWVAGARGGEVAVGRATRCSSVQAAGRADRGAAQTRSKYWRRQACRARRSALCNLPSHCRRSPQRRRQLHGTVNHSWRRRTVSGTTWLWRPRCGKWVRDGSALVEVQDAAVVGLAVGRLAAVVTLVVEGVAGSNWRAHRRLASRAAQNLHTRPHQPMVRAMQCACMHRSPTVRMRRLRSRRHLRNRHRNQGRRICWRTLMPPPPARGR